jgi:hypothetical protein
MLGNQLKIESSNDDSSVSMPHNFHIWQVVDDSTCSVLDIGENILYNPLPECVAGTNLRCSFAKCVGGLRPSFLSRLRATYVLAVEGGSGLRGPVDFSVSTVQKLCDRPETDFLVNFAGTEDRQFTF